jgi:hypothetical protein
MASLSMSKVASVNLQPPDDSMHQNEEEKFFEDLDFLASQKNIHALLQKLQGKALQKDKEKIFLQISKQG